MVFVCLGAVLVFLAFAAWVAYSLQPMTVAGHPASGETGVRKELRIAVSPGDGVRGIADALRAGGVIRSTETFKWYGVVTGKARNIKTGTYDFSSDMGVPAIYDFLVAGGENEVTVTIPEGLALKDVQALLVAGGVWDPGTPVSGEIAKLAPYYPFLEGRKESYEGFLFPDTYRFERGAPPEKVLRAMLDNFGMKAWPSLRDRKDWYGALTVASLLEREVKTFADRRRVAGVLEKRSAIGMPLQVDATILYAKCAMEYKTCPHRGITRDDTKIPGPYNTYMNRGLPPTPIGNPGAEAVKAALDPERTPYLYYLTARDGTTLFSATLEEHNAKRAKYM